MKKKKWLNSKSIFTITMFFVVCCFMSTSLWAETVGNTTVFGSTSTSNNRRALPFTMPENGDITSVTIYHTGGSGSMILGVYDGEGAPQNRLGVTPTTAVSSSTGWQSINLTSPAFVSAGSTVWLAWVYESNPGIAYEVGTPGRVDADVGWPGGMPDPFGSGTQADYLYSIYASYTPAGCVEPVAEFTADKTTIFEGQSVQFSDTSVNNPTSWSWDFGDGGNSTDQNPSHTYIPPGTYTVTLTATNAAGSDTETKVDYITVLLPQPPIADFTASATSISVGDNVTFTDQSLNIPTSWDWTFEGGTPATSTDQNPTVTYNTVGTYNVTLVATNAQGSDSETKFDYINVAEEPYCTSSGGSQSYEYIAGVAVGVFSNPSGASPYTDFTCLKICLIQGNSASVSLTPGFNGSSYTEYWKIWIDYNGDNDFEDAGEEVFSGSGSSIVTGNFTVPASTIIGDTRMRVSMSYSTHPPKCGSFNYGEVEDYTVNIAADNQAPAADFVGSPTSGQAPLIVKFTNQSTNSPTSWSWDFGDGGSSTAQSPVYTYTAGGDYTVTLTVTNAYGADTMTNFFSVKPAGDTDEPEYTQEDKTAIDHFLMNPNPTIVTIEPDWIGPEGFLNLMFQLTSGMHIALQVDMLDFGISTGAEVEIHTSTGTYVVLNADQEVEQIPIETVSNYMTSGKENTRYWCLRDDGDESSGPIVKAIMTVKANGSTLDNVLVQLRRDPLEQDGQDVISGPTPIFNAPCDEEEEWVWVISWFSDDCKRDDCSGICGVTLSSLIDLFVELGIPLPVPPSIAKLISKLINKYGISVGGDCAPVRFLFIFNIGCQCILHRF